MKKMIFVFIAVILAMGLAAMLEPAGSTVRAAGDFYVDIANAGDPLEDGTAAHPFDTIQEGIDAANAASGGTVHVAAGTYYENITLANNVEVIGAGNASTSIDGMQAGHVVTASGVSASIDGFTVMNGSAAEGGGIYISSASLTVTNCTVKDNTATSSSYTGGGIYGSLAFSTLTMTGCTLMNNNASQGDGGGMCIFSGTATINNCRFVNNSAGKNGGAVHSTYTTLQITGCAFDSNSAVSNAGGAIYGATDPSKTLTATYSSFSNNDATTYGGGIYVTDSGTANIGHCDFKGNNASASGGGMYIYWASASITFCNFSDNNGGSGGGIATGQESTPTIEDCTFKGNHALSGNGGGISNNAYDGSTVVTRCDFISNTAAQKGGGMYHSRDPLNITNCTFDGNGAGTDGGGFYNNQASPSARNCSFKNNAATQDGGGMYNYAGSPTLVNCLFISNSAGLQGGGIYGDHTASYMTITNCTLWNNSAAGTGDGINNYWQHLSIYNSILWENGTEDIQNEASITYLSIGHSDIGTIVGYFIDAGSNINLDPQFVNAAGGDFHLQSGSPCIDTGDNAAPSVPATDFEGDARPFDGNGDLTAVVDMGADEWMDADGDGISDNLDPCPNDPDNDIDGDGLCADVDNCPNDPNNDIDGDGLCADVDNCPNIANADQADADGDGVGDVCDACPNDPNNDIDGDGVCADVDNCPTTANADQADANGNGIGDVCESTGGGEGAALTPPEATMDVLVSGGVWEVSSDGYFMYDVTLSSEDGSVTIFIPSGTLALGPNGLPVTTIDVNMVDPPPAPSGMHILAAFAFEPSGATFSPGIEITISFDPSEVAAGETVVIAFFNEVTGSYEFIEGTINADGTATFTVSHFTIFAVMAGTVDQSPTPTPSTPATTTGPTATAAPAPSADESGGLSVATWVGIAVGVILVILIVILAFRRRSLNY